MPPLAIIGGALAVGGTVGKAIAGASEAEARGQLALKQEQLGLPTAAELADLDRNLQAEERIVQRSERLIAAVDPALIEAGRQAEQLLRGKEAAILGPQRRQRQQQRDQLRNRLREQLGPGFETSTAGSQALNQFDQQSSDLATTTQFQAVGQLLGSAQRSAELASQQQLGAAGLSLDRLKARGRLQERQITTTGGKERGDIFSAQATGSLFGDIAGIGGGLVGGSLGKDGIFKNLFSGESTTASTDLFRNQDIITSDVGTPSIFGQTA